MSFGQWASDYLGVPLEERFNFNPLTYFLYSGIDGAWFDPSDLSTLYQDAAGTIPVTAVEQPVGLMLDKSGNGYHATQSITASRPTLSARKNVLLATETLATQSVTTLAATYTLSFTGTGSVTLSGTSTGTLTGNGTDRVSLTFTPTAGTLTLTVSGGVTKAQLELGAVAGPYQRVTTSTDYDGTAAPKYLLFDMAGDYLNLPFMNLYGGGAASIVCARNAVSQAIDTYIISERSTTDIDPKYFPSRQLASAGNMDAYISDDAGTVVLDTVGSPFSGVADAVIQSIVDSGNNLKLFKNGVLAANDNYTRSGALTLNNTTIGASVSTTTSNYASMKLYGLIITKSALTDAQRIACERHLSRKSGVIL